MVDNQKSCNLYDQGCDAATVSTTSVDWGNDTDNHHRGSFLGRKDKGRTIDVIVIVIACDQTSKCQADIGIDGKPRGVTKGSSVRHKKHNSLGASPFRRRGSGQHSLAASASASPGRITASRSGSGSSSGGIFRTTSHQEGESPSVVSSTYPSLPPSMLRRDDLTDFSQDNINPFIKDMPSALSGQDGIDLTLPSMSGRGQRQTSARDVGIAGSSVDTTKKYPSPQSLVEEAMQSTAKVVPTAAGSTGGRFPHIFGHRRTRTPTRPAGTNASSSVSVGHPNHHHHHHHHRRINSMDQFDGCCGNQDY
ncbi:hypothetical protein IV203_028385 [Nitzschia inconspicua]|uniref:Uncharacterized protein n=1 Tax=Nitzschia inconspicua TaxID=303405 RepID=A0A9K3LPI3_9STRA|nr:hypothetical protein IV203_028385 [Nitzschia inconspicua]